MKEPKGAAHFERRQQNFGVDVRRIFDDFYGADFISVQLTTNGLQTQIMDFTQDEWCAIIAAVNSEFE